VRLHSLVDDDEELRSSLAEFLEEKGLRVVVAADGTQALAALKPGNGRPCILLLDWVMPELGGHEVIEWMADKTHLAGVPVYVVTGSPQLVTDVVPVIEKSNLGGILQAIRRHCHSAIAA